MATYTIIPLADGASSNVVVISDGGTCHTMRGFETEADAEEWIAHDRELGGPVEDC